MAAPAVTTSVAPPNPPSFQTPIPPSDQTPIPPSVPAPSVPPAAQFSVPPQPCQQFVAPGMWQAVPQCMNFPYGMPQMLNPYPQLQLQPIQPGMALPAMIPGHHPAIIQQQMNPGFQLAPHMHMPNFLNALRPVVPTLMGAAALSYLPHTLGLSDTTDAPQPSDLLPCLWFLVVPFVLVYCVIKSFVYYRYRRENDDQFSTTLKAQRVLRVTKRWKRRVPVGAFHKRKDRRKQKHTVERWVARIRRSCKLASNQIMSSFSPPICAMVDGQMPHEYPGYCEVEADANTDTCSIPTWMVQVAEAAEIDSTPHRPTDTRGRALPHWLRIVGDVVTYSSPTDQTLPPDAEFGTNDENAQASESNPVLSEEERREVRRNNRVKLMLGIDVESDADLNSSTDEDGDAATLSSCSPSDIGIVVPPSPFVIYSIDDDDDPGVSQANVPVYRPSVPLARVAPMRSAPESSTSAQNPQTVMSAGQNSTNTGGHTSANARASLPNASAAPPSTSASAPGTNAHHAPLPVIPTLAHRRITEHMEEVKTKVRKILKWKIPQHPMTKFSTERLLPHWHEQDRPQKAQPVTENSTDYLFGQSLLHLLWTLVVVLAWWLLRAPNRFLLLLLLLPFFVLVKWKTNGRKVALRHALAVLLFPLQAVCRFMATGWVRNTRRDTLCRIVSALDPLHFYVHVYDDFRGHKDFLLSLKPQTGYECPRTRRRVLSPEPLTEFHPGLQCLVILDYQDVRTRNSVV